MDDLIKRDDALRIVEEYDVLHDHIKALPVVTVGVKPLYFGGQGDPFVATQEDGVEYTIKDAGNWWEWSDNIGHWSRGYGSQEGAMFGAEAQDLARLHSTLELTSAIDPTIDPAAIREAALQARIEELVKERDDYKDLFYAGFKDAASLNIHYAEVGYKAKTAEAKLAKAVEALQEIADYTYFSLEHGDTQNAEARIARKVLAELEKS